MHYILFDNNWLALHPLTLTRPTAALRIGIMTIAEKWQLALNNPNVGYLTAAYLSGKYPTNLPSNANTVVCFINGAVVPTPALVEAIKALKETEALYYEGVLIACFIASNLIENIDSVFIQAQTKKSIAFQVDAATQKPIIIQRTWDLFTHNKAALILDFNALTKDRVSAPISATNTVLGDSNQIFIEEGTSVECAILNVKEAPIYIGKNAEIMEGAIIRGGLGLCEGAGVKAGAKLYGANTIGPHSKIGGEMSNSVVLGFSNKGHDGFLGNSVLGEWCNLGADTNNSNLKNNYSQVEMWDFESQKYISTNLTFCGLIMGDHSKCGINTMFNTGTTVGVSVNFYGAGYPNKYIPSFAWGGNEGFSTYRLDKVLETASRVVARRHLTLSSDDISIMQHVFDNTQKERSWE